MVRTLEELDKVVSKLTVELEELKRERSESLESDEPHRFDRHAGRFTDDEDWLPMMEEIQRTRREQAECERAESDLVAA